MSSDLIPPEARSIAKDILLDIMKDKSKGGKDITSLIEISQNIIGKTMTKDIVGDSLVIQPEVNLILSEFKTTDEKIKEEIKPKVRFFSKNKAPLLIQGETGTGKDIIARAIGAGSPPFIAFNSTAIPEQLFESLLFGHLKGAFTSADRNSPGLVEAAGKGTLFFDEIGDLPPSLQAKLLRLIQNKEYRKVGSTTVEIAQCRFIFATCQDTSHLRRDLLNRISACSIKLPPLRDRPLEDLSLLVRHFVSSHDSNMGLLQNEGFLQGIINNLEDRRNSGDPFEGNVREIQAAVADAVFHAELTKFRSLYITD